MDLKDRILKIAAGALIVDEHVTAEIANWRMGICEGCDQMDFKNLKCLDCGCFLDLKTNAATNWKPSKMRLEITHCPRGKWNDLEIANQYRSLDGKELLTL